MQREFTWWNSRTRRLVQDFAVPGALIAFDVISAVHGGGYPNHFAWECVASAVLVVRRRFPVTVLLIVGVLLALQYSVLPAIIALYSVAARRGPSLVVWLGGLGVGVAMGVQVFDLPNNRSLLNIAALLGLFVFAPVLGGLWMFQRATLLTVLRERAEEAERTRTLLAEQALSAERRRIAREMHDAVGHRVTAIALQAGALSLNAPDERTSKFAETIRSVSATALDELRDILRVLRDDAPQGEASPWRAGQDLPASIEELVKDMVETGAKIELSLPSAVPEISKQVERAVYRVVQESLTNAGKHAPHAAIRVTITSTDNELAVEVTNYLTPVTANVGGSGYGLIGMRERVELAGGELDAGRLGRTFRVFAKFPAKPRTGEKS